MKVLVTGGAGFIGSHFCNRLVEPAVVLDKLSYAADLDNIRHLHTDRIVIGDICNGDLIREILHKHRITTIVHFAAESHVDRSIRDSSEFVTTNIVGTHTLITEARRYFESKRIKGRFIHISTDEVYGVAVGETKFTEDTPYAPNSPYAASKAASDFLVRSFVKTYNFPAIITHCSNNFGPHQHDEKLIPTVIRSLVRRQPIPVYGSGTQVRDWIYVADHCRALELIMYHGKIGSVYNIGGQEKNTLTNLELIHMLCNKYDALTSYDQKSYQLIQHVADRPGHDYRYCIDSTRFLSDFEFEYTNLDCALNATIGFYRERYADNFSSKKD